MQWRRVTDCNNNDNIIVVMIIVLYVLRVSGIRRSIAVQGPLAGRLRRVTLL